MRSVKYRTGLKRFGAAIVDGIVFMPLLLFEQWLLNLTQNMALLSVWVIFAAFLPIFYSIILHYKYGQTIGKWVVEVKVLHVSETRNINLKESIFRDIVYLSVEIFGLCYFLFPALRSNRLATFVQDFSNFSGTPLFIWNLLELITMLANSKRRAIHDFLARSVVIRTSTSG
jgi:uncharacterized RDD family membrane protein YckC